jgi:hypothetical protein
MNCLEFRRLKLADPRRVPPEAATHGATCPACADFARSVDETERELEQALARPVPDGLADRIILRSRAKGPAWRSWAMAAGIVLTFAAALLYTGQSREAADGYARLAIEHVATEPESFSTLNAAAAQPVAELVRASGGRLKAPLGTVRYIKLCPMEHGGTGWHIVFETAEGLATLLIVPGTAPSGMQQASSGDWNALAQPTRRGYYAVVTRSARQTALVDRLVRSRIDWDV